MPKQIDIKLNPKSVESAIRQIRTYQRSLDNKLKLFCEKLATDGIMVAQREDGYYGQFIEYSRKTKITSGENGKTIEVLLIAKNSSYPIHRWDTGESTMNPIMMAEFGSGKYADDSRGKPFGGGRGTHPEGRINKKTEQLNASNDDGWTFSVAGQVFHEYGESPTYPMMNAFLEMKNNIESVAREVFGGGM